MRTKRTLITALMFLLGACGPDITNVLSNVNNSHWPTVAVTGVVMTPATVTLNFGICSNTSQQFAVTVYPSNATDQTFTFSITNNGAATLNGFGIVTGVKAGVDTVTAKSNADSTKIAQSIITVTSCVPPPVSVTGITISPTTISLSFGGTCSNTTQTLSATVSPSNATNQGFVFSVTNHGSVTLSGNTLTSAKVGVDTVYVTALGDATKKSFAVVTVTACPPLPAVDTTLTLSPAGGSGISGSTGQVTAVVTGPVGMDKTVLYYSTAPNIVYVLQSDGTAVVSSNLSFPNVLAGFLYFGTPGTAQVCGQLKVAPLIRDCKPWTSH